MFCFSLEVWVSKSYVRRGGTAGASLEISLHFLVQLICESCMFIFPLGGSVPIYQGSQQTREEDALQECGPHHGTRCSSCSKGFVVSLHCMLGWQDGSRSSRCCAAWATPGFDIQAKAATCCVSSDCSDFNLPSKWENNKQQNKNN